MAASKAVMWVVPRGEDEQVIELTEADLLAGRIAAWAEEIVTADLGPAGAAEVATHTRRAVATAMTAEIFATTSSWTDVEHATAIDTALAREVSRATPMRLATLIVNHLRELSAGRRPRRSVAVPIPARIAALVEGTDRERFARSLAARSGEVVRPLRPEVMRVAPRPAPAAMVLHAAALPPAFAFAVAPPTTYALVRAICLGTAALWLVALIAFLR